MKNFLHTTWLGVKDMKMFLAPILLALSLFAFLMLYFYLWAQYNLLPVGFILLIVTIIVIFFYGIGRIVKEEKRSNQ